MRGTSISTIPSLEIAGFLDISDTPLDDNVIASMEPEPEARTVEESNVTANEVSVISLIIRISSQMKGFASQLFDLYKPVMDFVR
ncbi:hypothetical protein FQZ97_829220 [compost metagenome]